MEILNVQHLCKTYGSGETRVEALKDVSFTLQKGEFAAVVGESGSGKSTLLHCIGALDTPTAGTVLVDGQNLFAMKEEKRTVFRRRCIGFVFQAYQLVPELDVEQNIIFPLLLDYRRPDPAAVEDEIGWQLRHLSLDACAALARLPLLGEDAGGPLGPGLLASGIRGVVIRRIQAGLRVPGTGARDERDGRGGAGTAASVAP